MLTRNVIKIKDARVDKDDLALLVEDLGDAHALHGDEFAVVERQALRGSAVEPELEPVASGDGTTDAPSEAPFGSWKNAWY